MKKHIVVLGIFVFLAVAFAASTMLNSAVIRAQVQQRVAQAQKEPKTQKPSVISINPQKITLARGGDAIVVEIRGTNLTMIDSVQVIRGGLEAVGIEEVLDRSQLPTLLKITLRATLQAKLANDYGLAMFDAGKKKILEVPGNLVAIDTVPLPERKLTPPPPATPGLETGKRTPKVEAYLKSIETAQSLEEVWAGFEKANFSQTESGGLKRQVEASPVLKQKLEGLVKQEETKGQAKIAQYRREALAKVNSLKSQYATSQQAKMRTAADLATKLRPGTCPPSDKLIIEKISGEPIEPGVVFAVSGKGFGTESGYLDLIFGGNIYPADIMEWTECYVHARLKDNITGVRSSKDAMLVLKKPDGKEIRRPTSFQPLLEYASIFDEETITCLEENIVGCLAGAGGVDFGESKDWTKNNFRLINDWVVKDRVFQVSSDRGHAEITYSSPLDVPNGSARTDVHAGRKAYGAAHWTLCTCVVGPRGLPYK